MRVLVVEDDPMIGRAVVAGLHQQGYAVDWVRDGAEAELALGHAVYDVELLARTRAVIRRHGGRSQSEIAYGALTLDPARRRVLFQGAEVELSPREFAVLEALLKEPGAVVSRERLEDAVYGWGEEVGSNSIEVHVHHLRRKLAPELIRNVRGVGYRIARIA